MDDFNGIVAGIAASTPRNINEYLAPDGVYRCRVCQQPTRTKIHIPGYGDFEPPITCDCDKAAEAARKERERLEEIDRKRRICFNQAAMRSWSFENDDRSNAKLSDAMLRYAVNFPHFLKEGKGLLLFGFLLQITFALGGDIGIYSSITLLFIGLLPTSKDHRK